MLTSYYSNAADCEKMVSYNLVKMAKHSVDNVDYIRCGNIDRLF